MNRNMKKKSANKSLKKSAKKSLKKTERKSQRKSQKKSNKKYLPTPTKGALGLYHTSDSITKRRKELLNIVNEIGNTSVIRDLNLRANLLKKSNKTSHDIMREDIEYIRNLK